MNGVTKVHTCCQIQNFEVCLLKQFAMVKKKTVDGWSIPCARYTLADDGETVTTMFCSVCRDYYGNISSSKPDHHGFIANVSDKMIIGTNIIKKCNIVDHVTKSTLHRQAVLHTHTSTKQDELSASGTTRQSTLSENVALYNKGQRAQLIKKFQLAHLITSRGRSFRDYETFGNFARTAHNIDLGSAYSTRHSVPVMSAFLADHIRQTEITKPLNSGERRYFSLFYDGSSCAKTMDEKEVYVIKTCKSGKPAFQVLSLEDRENTSATGLKASLENSLAKQGFTFDRKFKQVGVGSDGAAVNGALFQLEKEELGPHLIKGWCANHKLELAVHHAVRSSNLNKETETVLSNIFYLFKRANLKWRLFKRQADVLNLKPLKFKRPNGSRWVSHQVDSTINYLKNLPISLGFFHQNIHTPYNKTMADSKAKLQGHLKCVSKLELVIFAAARQDIFAYIAPFSQTLESQKLLAPEAITAMKNSIAVFGRIKDIITEQGPACFYMIELFPTLSKLVWPFLKDDGDILPVHRTRGLYGQQPQTFHGYSLTAGLDMALNKVHQELLEIVQSLEVNLRQRFSDFLDCPIFSAAAVLLDIRSYKFKSVDDLYESVEVLSNHFKTLLNHNSCDITKLRQELSCLHLHVISFLAKSCNEKAWLELFSLQTSLAISNILHIAEIAMVLLVSSSDVERVFSKFSRIMSKDRLSLSNRNIEQQLLLHSNDFDNYKSENYEQVIDKFLKYNADGNPRKRPPRLNRYKRQRKFREAPGTKRQNCLFLSDSDTHSLGSAGDQAATVTNMSVVRSVHQTLCPVQ